MADTHHNNRTQAEKLIRTLDPDYRQRWEVYDGILKRLTGPGARWLDGGCGRNEAIEEFPCDITVGLDVYRHPEALSAPPTHLVLGSMDDLPFRDGAFSLVTLNTVAEHFEHPEAVLREIHRILEPGGHVLLHTTNRRSPLIAIGNLFPESIRFKLMHKGFGAHEPDVFRAYHRLNTVDAITDIDGFEPVEFHAIQDLNWSNRLVFYGLLTYHMLSRLPGLWRLRTNFIALLRKRG